jgi:hypothetical protein
MPANGHKAALPKPALAPRSRTRGGGSSSKKLAVYMLVGGASALMLIEARRLWPTVEESSARALEPLAAALAVADAPQFVAAPTASPPPPAAAAAAAASARPPAAQQSSATASWLSESWVPPATAPELDADADADADDGVEDGGDAWSTTPASDAAAAAAAVSAAAVAAPLDDDAEWCTRMRNQHGVVVGADWGTISEEGKGEWTVRGCDAILRGGGGGAPSVVGLARPAGAVARLAGTSPIRRRRRTTSSKLGVSAPLPTGEAAVAACDRLHKRGVVPGTSWGTLTTAEQRRWSALDCDRIDPTIVAERNKEAAYLGEYTSHLGAMLNARPQSRRIARIGGGGGKTVVAVCVCTTSRSIAEPSLSSLALFSVMLPSLVQSLKQEATGAAPAAAAGGGGGLSSWLLGGGVDVNGISAAAGLPSALGEQYEFWLYVLFDAGDSFYDSPARETEVLAWIDANVAAPLRESAGVTLRPALLRFENTMHKPGPAFNFMMRAAYDDGADYLYRINDDTMMVGAWARTAVATLRGFSPPNVGVVGPTCAEGNANIMTHDLVHRTHLQIFETYYPPIFSDWWMDDWITHVYGERRTRKGPFRVRHMIGVQGTRYAVDQSHSAKLASELSAGGARIAKFLDGGGGARQAT